ncbi:MAG: PfkB family carbohydrate kinase [Planctomycetota bacterium]|nr:PfkB family carbohydrate kinase [Planctomycetota bacterium]
MNDTVLTKARLEELVRRFPSCRIAVVGDFFLDRYLDVDPGLEETSVETGLPAHQVVGARSAPGAAGTVVSNLAALGAGQLHAVGLTGVDGSGFELRRGLEALGCSAQHLHETSIDTPTYLKPRNMNRPGLAGEHSRYDTKNRSMMSDAAITAVLDSVRELLPDIDAFIISDQVEQPDCGVITATVRNTLGDIAAKSPNVVFWADSRRRIREFRNIVLKPNQFEVLGIENPPPGQSVNEEELLRTAGELRRRTGTPLFVTRGEQGMLVSDPAWTSIPTVRLAGDIDPTGAGDSTTAGCVLALCAGATIPEAGLVGNLVASITVQQLATTGVARPNQLLDRFELWREQQHY